MLKVFRAFSKDESGATAIEYALIAGGIAIAIVGAVTLLGGAVTGSFENISSSL